VAFVVVVAVPTVAFVVFQRAKHPLYERVAPPYSPVSLRIVYTGESRLDGANCVRYSGTAQYTFTNTWPWPVTLAFPPVVHYTYGENFQDFPFPDKDRMLPEFAKERREVVIPAGKSIDFTSKFAVLCRDKGWPQLSVSFVFGMPSSPCEHPVLGTVYAPVEYMESPKMERN
jgi:hypothetical protein